MNKRGGLAAQIGSATAIIMVCSLADKILAVGREMLTAQRFGISSHLDAFNVAYSFPAITVLLFSGSLVSAFVPLYLEWRTKTSPPEADSHAGWLLWQTTLFFAALTLVGFLLSPIIIEVLGYGMGTREKHLGVAMERMLVLLMLIDGAGIVFRGVLHARKMFFHLYIAPIFINSTLVLFLYFGVGEDIRILVWGFLVGTLLKTAYMGVVLGRRGFRLRPKMPYPHRHVKELWYLALPLLGSQLIANSNMLVDQFMATLLPAGSVSTLRYAFRINDLPVQIVILAISRAIFPYISEQAAHGQRENLQRIYHYSLIFLGFITFPITCLVVLFAEDIVILLLKRGAFGLDAARLTAQALTGYSLGLFFYAYTFVNGSFFAALKNTSALLYMGLVSIGLNALFNGIFMFLIGAAGIALSSSVTMCIVSVWFVVLLRRRLGMTDTADLFSSFSRLVAAAAGMLGAGYLLRFIFAMADVSRWVYIPLCAVVTGLVYLAVVWMLRNEGITNCLGATVRAVSVHGSARRERRRR